MGYIFSKEEAMLMICPENEKCEMKPYSCCNGPHEESPACGYSCNKYHVSCIIYNLKEDKMGTKKSKQIKKKKKQETIVTGPKKQKKKKGKK